MFHTSRFLDAVSVLSLWFLLQQVTKQRVCHPIPFMIGKSVENQELQLRRWSGLPKNFKFTRKVMSKLRDLQSVVESTPFENVFNAGTEESMPYATRLSMVNQANLVPTFGEAAALHIVQHFAYHMRIVPDSDFTHLQRCQFLLRWILQEKAPLEARRLIIRGNDALDLPLRSLFMRAAAAMCCKKRNKAN